MFESTIRDDVLALERPETRWLSTGWDGGTSVADHAYNVTVPEGWQPDSIDEYVADRLADAGFPTRDAAPVLLTGVAQRHARLARCGPVAAAATVGVSNPAALPMDADGGALPNDPDPVAGTVNVVVGTTRRLDDAALANLVAVAAEAKTATLLATAGFPGTTSDAVVAACDPAGEPSAFSGSATRVGAAARACVRDAVRASLDSRYEDEELPDSVDDARHGVSTDVRADVVSPSE
ncbi:adenosylcobinamide amidohydrolase [Halobacterium jilantaiense]|uniref:Adenosylcobinamide hydrolase n=1 Tax=Halobacterium jilantaiense TaxID=355548 RepID=A0A1I0QM85_9EURY|nr:adenosylcobinamide amidohydrolase [Halobacterium jilantaiense]SEW28295.1 adenosylcobinamide hydrolase [Halobacterium jilantaiense]